MKQKLLAMLLLASCSAWSADQNGHYWAGDDLACGIYVEVRKDPKNVTNTMMSSWVMGYVTAFNKQTPETYDIMGNTSTDKLMLRLEKYCDANPLNTVSQGMDVLTQELHPQRMKTK
ncbi:MAG: hypothetical protein P8Y76_06075 [bacterium]|jgi:hypothetical protein